MDPQIAEARLKNMTAWECAPALEQADIDLLLLACRRVDDAGLMWNDPAWVPTYFLDWAAREAWAWKAGATADHYKLISDGTELDRHQIYEHCVRMHNMYDKRAVGRPQNLRSTGNLVEDRLAFNPVPWWYQTDMIA